MKYVIPNDSSSENFQGLNAKKKNTMTKIKYYYKKRVAVVTLVENYNKSCVICTSYMLLENKSKCNVTGEYITYMALCLVKVTRLFIRSIFGLL